MNKFRIVSICDIAYMAGRMDARLIKPEKPPINKIGATAIIPIRGVIDREYSWSGSPPDEIAANIYEALNDAEVARIVLHIDSPGGSISGLTQVADMIFAARQVKPIVAQVDGMAASAAYWLASQASKIYLGRLDQVGSIGVRAMLYDYSALYEKEGVKPVLIDTGIHKSTGVEGMPITDEQIDEIRAQVNQVFAEFLSAVGRGRNMDISKVKAVADGRMFMGEKALAAGLADGIQSLNYTIANPDNPVMTATRAAQIHGGAVLAKIKAESLLIDSAESENSGKNE